MTITKHFALNVLTRLVAWTLAFTFLFSGFVKAVDPKGMCIKLNAYLSHWGYNVPDDALLLKMFVVVLATIEFLLGVYLFLGIRRRLTLSVTTLLMVVMTALTAYVYIYNPVDGCGCFGSAIKLTNGETFLKNIVLLFLVTGLWFRRKLPRLSTERNQWLTSIWAFIYIIALSLYSFHYLPTIGFTDYKLGADVKKAVTDFESEESFSDLTNFILSSSEGDMLQDSIIFAPGKAFLLVITDGRTVDEGSNDRINNLYDYAKDHHIPFYGAIPQEQESFIEEWIDKTGAAYPMLLGESTQLKAMMRSNPGLLMFDKGVLSGIWSNNNLPELSPQTTLDSLKQNHSPSQALMRLLAWLLIPIVVIIIADNIWLGSKYYKHYKLIQSLKQTQQ